MSSFARWLDRAIQPLNPLIVGAAVLCWIVVAYGEWRQASRRPLFPHAPRRRGRFFFPGAVVFLGLVGFKVAVGSVIRTQASNEARLLLSASVRRIAVDSKDVATLEPLLSELRALDDGPFHHSHPTREFVARLETTEGPLVLLLDRDSQDPREYWVFYPRYRSNPFLGKLRTSALDAR